MIEPILPEMITLPAGPVWMGAADDDPQAAPDEQPAGWVDVPSFTIAQTPVTTAEFVRFVETGRAKPRRFWGGLRPPPGLERHPVTNVSWADATAYCEWLAESTGRPFRLPAEAEWERAARGDTFRRWPWGDTFDPACANVLEAKRTSTTPVDAHPDGASPFGVLDMAGNVWEWNSDLYRPYPYRKTTEAKALPLPPGQYEDSRRTLRGGSRMAEARWARCSARVQWHPHYIFSGHVGFRVACDH